MVFGVFLCSMHSVCVHGCARTYDIVCVYVCANYLHAHASSGHTLAFVHFIILCMYVCVLDMHNTTKHLF